MYVTSSSKDLGIKVPENFTQNGEDVHRFRNDDNIAAIEDLHSEGQHKNGQIGGEVQRFINKGKVIVVGDFNFKAQNHF